MNELALFNLLLVSWFVLGLPVFIALFFYTAPYGRHNRRGWGFQINSRLGWVLMEAPSAVGMVILFALGNKQHNLTAIIFLIMWEAHYLQRAFIFPFLIREKQKKMPISIVLMSVVFNGMNVYLNGRYLFYFASDYPSGWFSSLPFILGFALFIFGYFINRQSDQHLRTLRSDGSTTYKIPVKGLFRQVSCPNYFGEIIEWLGWAIATWSFAGACFAFWTIVNLAPRAKSHHQWYQEAFDEYPPERKALIPWLW